MTTESFRPELLVFDIDGVLTDGTAELSVGEGEGKRFSFKDLDALGQARRAGLKIAAITAEDTAAVTLVAERFGINLVKQGASDKVAALNSLADETGVDMSNICYVGDGDRDVGALERAALGMAPANATVAAKAAADRLLTLTGGRGAVAEAVGLVLWLRDYGQQAGGIEQDMRSIARDSIEAHERLISESLPDLARIAVVLTRTIVGGHKLLLCGNGGSAADAQHVAGELVGRFAIESGPWPAIALTTDTSVLTAVANDWDYSEVFARQIRALARPGDLVAGISTSGRSVNIVRALEAARRVGVATVAFVGSDGGAVCDHGDFIFRAPAQSTPRVQELHLLAWHMICEIVERNLEERRDP